MTIDMDGRNHEPAGAPGGRGGQFATSPTPDAAVQLTVPRQTVTLTHVGTAFAEVGAHRRAVSEAIALRERWPDAEAITFLYDDSDDPPFTSVALRGRDGHDVPLSTVSELFPVYDALQRVADGEERLTAAFDLDAPTEETDYMARGMFALDPAVHRRRGDRHLRDAVAVLLNGHSDARDEIEQQLRGRS